MTTRAQWVDMQREIAQRMAEVDRDFERFWEAVKDLSPAEQDAEFQCRYPLGPSAFGNEETPV